MARRVDGVESLDLRVTGFDLEVSVWGELFFLPLEAAFLEVPLEVPMMGMGWAATNVEKAKSSIK